MHFITFLQNKASGYFTAQRLVYIHKNTDSLTAKSKQLDPDVVDLHEIINKISELETSTKNLNRTVIYIFSIFKISSYIILYISRYIPRYYNPMCSNFFYYVD